jgi:glutamate formiminotransferase
MPLIAYNINLGTDDLDVARTIAASVRFRNGGLPFVKAMGVRLAERGIVQVSMNLTNYRETSMFRVYEAVKRAAAQHGVSILESEIIGLVPSAALEGGNVDDLNLTAASRRQVLEERLAGNNRI